MRRDCLLWGTAAAGLTVDQVTKALAADGLEGRTPVSLFGGAVHLTVFRNPGAAGSFAPHATAVFTLIAAVVLAGIIRVAPTVRSAGWAVALGLVFAGAGGNLTDRLFRAPALGRGAVLDFIRVGHGGIFNLADQCVTIGSLLIVVLVFRGIPLRPGKPAAEPG